MSDLRAAADKHIEDNNLDANIVHVDDHHVVIEVSRKDYFRAYDTDPDFNVSWEQRTPPLVGAEIGDLVLVYNRFDEGDDFSDVGLVSAKFTNEDGHVTYGCRHIMIELGGPLGRSIYDLEITAENYAGHPEGFLKVLTPDEAIAHLKRRLYLNYQRVLEGINAKFTKTNARLDEFVHSLGNFKKVQCESLDVNDQAIPYTLSVNIVNYG